MKFLRINIIKSSIILWKISICRLKRSIDRSIPRYRWTYRGHFTAHILKDYRSNDRFYAAWHYSILHGTEKPEFPREHYWSQEVSRLQSITRLPSIAFACLSSSPFKSFNFICTWSSYSSEWWSLITYIILISRFFHDSCYVNQCNTNPIKCQ